ncbi:hypothetical protein Acr_00g0004190 [Actinidia rufa]|uniref:Uncharacterized protein n=1 Tax=Actinidia rufa TaxID=165716 RepID=A0A7J0D7D1_9ERIC|nr:hypothetical protein Acr_00g0004190 [Actinidia rufa]
MALSDMWVGVESPFERSLGSPLPGHQKPESSGTRARKKPSSLTLFSLLIAVGAYGQHYRAYAPRFMGPIPTPDMASWGTSYKKGRSAKWIAKGKFLLRTSSMTKQKYSGLVNKNQFLLLHGVHYHSK